MKDAVKLFLEGDLLERYLTGETDVEENLQSEYFIETYPEVREEYEKLQLNLEQYARSFAQPLPENVKQAVRDSIKTPVIALNTEETNSSRKPMRWYIAAAVASTVLLGSTSVSLWNQNKMLSTQKNAVVDQLEGLKSNIVETNSKLELLKSKNAVLSDPDTRQYVFKGNERAKNLRSVAYINPKEGMSAINIVSLPDLPEDKEFQMWAEVDGKMVSLGVLEKADLKLMSLPHSDKASGYKITIQNKGNKDFAAIDSEVARIEFNKEE
ncbi:anti-sigma factor [Robertkochia marina]|uniref:Anti-sigma factor n=1 Tax=Robertkochia marina TaxID=1227945 RepID=A0A4S3LXS3_9FLAO|nr:anti-sigma factor [Robertkochia marina]THD66359.1 anti-sigma factor [Robertkochia marina]TRZ44040.1 RNA polymerase subunit sigma-70 [Robertkochia marina]